MRSLSRKRPPNSFFTRMTVLQATRAGDFLLWKSNGVCIFFVGPMLREWRALCILFSGADVAWATWGGEGGWNSGWKGGRWLIFYYRQSPSSHLEWRQVSLQIQFPFQSSAKWALIDCLIAWYTYACKRRTFISWIILCWKPIVEIADMLRFMNLY